MRAGPFAASAAVVVPVRSFADGKARLAPRLPAPERALLTRRLAEIVVRAAGDLPVVVVSSAPDVASWARSRDLAVLPDPGTLDRAATDGIAWCRSVGANRAVVAHADLPRASSFAVVLDGPEGEVVVVPDRSGDGTPVLVVPVDAPFRCAYGPGSFARHCAEARRLGLGPRVVEDPDLGFDVDLPEDLDLLDDAGALLADRADVR